MNMAETLKLLTIIGSAYRNFEVPQTEEDMKLHTWHKMLKDLGFNLAQASVQKHIAENKYPPSISEIREQAVEVENYEEGRLTAGEAWGKVIQAVRDYGYYREQEALDSLPEKAAKTAEALGWQSICDAKEEGVARGQFLKIYKQIAERDRQDDKLPGETREAIKQLTSEVVSEVPEEIEEAG